MDETKKCIDRLWSEAVRDHGHEVTVWSPEMERPLVQHGNHMDDAVLVDSKLIIEALQAGRNGRL